MGRISLEQRLNVDLEDPDTDKRNPNGIRKCQYMKVNEDQLLGKWAKTRETFRIPGDSSRSQWIGQSLREVVISDGGVGRATRAKRLSKKSLA